MDSLCGRCRECFIDLRGQRNRRNSTMEDTSRVNYLHAYIGSVLDAVSLSISCIPSNAFLSFFSLLNFQRNGSNTRGYFAWSFLDVFELLDGYESGYGFYYVDLDDPDLKRYPKLSAHWYSHFLKGGSISSDVLIKLKQNFFALSQGHFSQ
ncbi:hypothetical protein SCA6_014709 [Theobroma cacao]